MCGVNSDEAVDLFSCNTENFISSGTRKFLALDMFEVDKYSNLVQTGLKLRMILFSTPNSCDTNSQVRNVMPMDYPCTLR